MRAIKKYKNNEYSKTKSGIWVRNPTKSAYPLDINNLTNKKDYELFIQNEVKLKPYNPMMLDDLKIIHRNCVVVSDGFEFKNKQKLLATIQDEYTVIGVNGALRKWNPKVSQMHYYVVNNPYTDCCSFLPAVRYFPTCILAPRTNSDFIKKYKGNLIKYTPTYDSGFTGADKRHGVKIDDYRNPICAAINIALFMGAENILLFCCDNVFKDKRDGAEEINGLYTYPQNNVTHEIVDELAYFIKNENEFFRISNFSSGYVYDNISNISEDGISKFFDAFNTDVFG